MDFDHSLTAQALQRQLSAFMARYVLPHNAAWHQAVQQGDYPPPFLEDLKTLAREEGLWNLFLPTLRDDEPGTRLANLDYSPLAEAMGRLPWASEVFNCSARSGWRPCWKGRCDQRLRCPSPTWPRPTRPICKPRCGAMAMRWCSTDASGSSPARRTRTAGC